MNEQLLLFLEHVAYHMRRSCVLMTTHAGSGHVTSSLSAADITSVLFFYAMRYDPANFHYPNNDRFILSKGHAAPILYAVWKELGKLDACDLLTYRSIGSTLEGHPTRRFAYAEAATGALGIGLSIGVGQALCARLDKRTYKTYVLLGDSELSEGCIWEAVQLAAFYKLNNLIGIVDCNGLGQSTPTMEALQGNASERFAHMFKAFGWDTYHVDGHDVHALMCAMDYAREKHDKPVMIIAQTKKGYGIDLIEGKQGYHGTAIPREQIDQALDQLKHRFHRAATYQGGFIWKPTLPERVPHAKPDSPALMLKPGYKREELVSTRKAYGQALTALGNVNEDVVSLDAEVKNSTYAELFEKAFPTRFFQCFIAEQNMIGMGVGFYSRGKIPFISTFGAFLSRAHDQIRMAAIGTAALRLVGSHAGVSIGQDGPSQMALEDIAMMRTLPESVVLYPSDAVSTYHLVHEMARYTKGISYLRTTRMETPVIYENSESFPIGGCKILRQSGHDRVCVIACGVTLFEALKAYDDLVKRNIFISVIDAYSIKPLDVTTIKTIVHASGNKVVTVEDHYQEGGLGEAVMAALCNDGVLVKCLAVTSLPRSGRPQELLADACIDATALTAQIHTLL